MGILLSSHAERLRKSSLRQVAGPPAPGAARRGRSVLMASTPGF